MEKRSCPYSIEIEEFKKHVFQNDEEKLIRVRGILSDNAISFDVTKKMRCLVDLCPNNIIAFSSKDLDSVLAIRNVKEIVAITDTFYEIFSDELGKNTGFYVEIIQ